LASLLAVLWVLSLATTAPGLAAPIVIDSFENPTTPAVLVGSGSITFGGQGLLHSESGAPASGSPFSTRSIHSQYRQAGAGESAASFQATSSFSEGALTLAVAKTGVSGMAYENLVLEYSLGYFASPAFDVASSGNDRLSLDISSATLGGSLFDGAILIDFLDEWGSVARYVVATGTGPVPTGSISLPLTSFTSESEFFDWTQITALALTMNYTADAPAVGNAERAAAFSHSVTVTNLALVPEPSTYCMALAGLACGGFSMWRRRKRA
jgi:hypothetical protein